MIQIDLSGKIALVTGASQGIGEEVARRMHEAGATVWLNHLEVETMAAKAEVIAKSLNAIRPGSAKTVAADVSQRIAVEKMMTQVQCDEGGLDILINNAAILRDRSLKKMTPADWYAVIDVNLSGVFHCTHCALPIIRDGGSIVSFGSIAAREGFFGQANYAAAKAGVESMMRVVARESGRRGIRANTIAPGVIETAMAEQIPEVVRERMLEHIPLGRFGQATEVANAILFLCSPLAQYITGHTLEINGGWRS